MVCFLLCVLMFRKKIPPHPLINLLLIRVHIVCWLYCLGFPDGLFIKTNQLCQKFVFNAIYELTLQYINIFFNIAQIELTHLAN